MEKSRILKCTPDGQGLGTRATSLRKVYFNTDLRKHPRIDTDFGAEVIAERGDSAIAVISDISRSGCRLESSRKFIDTILPNINHLDKRLPVTITVSFLLPQISDIVATAKCIIIDTNRLTRKSFQAGCRFTEFYGDSERYLRAYLLKVSRSDFHAGLSDIDNALVIARAIKDGDTSNNNTYSQHEAADIIESLVDARECFTEIQGCLESMKKELVRLSNIRESEKKSLRQLSANYLTKEEIDALLSDCPIETRRIR